MPLSSKSLEHEYLFNLTFTIHVHVIKLMSSRINALELMPGRIGRIQLYNTSEVDLASKLTGFIRLLHF